MGKLTYGSLVISGEDPDICLDLIEGYQLLPAVRGKDWVVPRQDYKTPGNRRKDRLVLPIAGIVKGSGGTPQERREDLNVNLTAVLAVLHTFAGFQTLTLSDGYLGLPVGSEATIEARTVNGAPGKMQNGQSAQLWTFELEAFEDWEIGS